MIMAARLADTAASPTTLTGTVSPSSAMPKAMPVTGSATYLAGGAITVSI
jgi:hypothetical protein